MGYRPDRERAGFCKVWAQDGSATVLHFNEYEPLTTALRAGESFYEGADLYGDNITIRLSEVVTVMQASRAGVSAYDADEIDRRTHETTTGDG